MHHVVAANAQLHSGNVQPFHGAGREPAGDDRVGMDMFQLVVVSVQDDLIEQFVTVRPRKKDLLNQGDAG